MAHMRRFMAAVALLYAMCDAAVTDAQEETCVGSKVKQQLVQARTKMNIHKQEAEEIATDLQNHDISAQHEENRPGRYGSNDRLPPAPKPGSWEMKTLAPRPGWNPPAPRPTPPIQRPTKPPYVKKEQDGDPLYWGR